MTSTTTLATVDFHGQSLIVVTAGDQHLVAMKPICEGIGLSWRGQNERILRDDVLKEGARVMRLPSAGGEQDTLCLPLELLNGWLFGIDVARCREEVRPALVQYKRECYAVLAAHWQKQEPPQAPSLISRRWLVGYDHNGRERVTEVPEDACVMSHKQMLEAINAPNGLLVETEELFDFLIATANQLRYRMNYQSDQLRRARKAGFRAS